MTRTRRWYFPNFRFSFHHKNQKDQNMPNEKILFISGVTPCSHCHVLCILIRSCVHMYIKMITSHLHDNFSESLYHFLLLVLWFVYLRCRNLATVKVAKVRYSVWSADMNFVALFSKHGKFWSHTFTSCLSALSAIEYRAQFYALDIL